MPGENGCPSCSTYQQPSRRPFYLPPLSKIPGLGEADVETKKQVAPLIKETDSPYVRLSKLGGHKNLLKMDKGNKIQRQLPVTYARNQWYCHQDNAGEDAGKRRPIVYQPSYYMGVKELITQDHGDNRKPSHNRQCSCGHISNNLRDLMPEKPLVNIPSDTGNGNLENVQVHMGQKDQPKDRSKKQSKSSKPCTEYESSFRAAVMQKKIKKPPRTHTYETGVPYHMECKGLAHGKKQADRFMLSKFKKVGPKVDTGEKR